MLLVVAGFKAQILSLPMTAVLTAKYGKIRIRFKKDMGMAKIIFQILCEMVSNNSLNDAVASTAWADETLAKC